MESRRAPAMNTGLLDRDGLLGSKALAEYLDVPVGTLDQWASRGEDRPSTRWASSGGITPLTCAHGLPPSVSSVTASPPSDHPGYPAPREPPVKPEATAMH